MTYVYTIDKPALTVEVKAKNLKQADKRFKKFFLKFFNRREIVVENPIVYNKYVTITKNKEER